MKKHFLYDKFNNWEDDFEKIVLYSDFHGVGNGEDKDAVDTHSLFSYAPDEEQIENINKIAYKKDLIVWLGDMGDITNLKNLKCKNWILITGNHDRGKQFYIDNGFLEVYTGPLFVNEKLLLSHAPIHNIPGIFNIHGHLHNLNEVDNNCFHDNYICISANLFGYKPLNLSALFKRKGDFKDFEGYSNCKGIHRFIIDRATARKQERIANGIN